MQLIEFLGFLVDSRSMRLSLTKNKVDQIQKVYKSLLRKNVRSLRQLDGDNDSVHPCKHLCVTVHFGGYATNP